MGDFGVLWFEEENANALNAGVTADLTPSGVDEDDVLKNPLTALVVFNKNGTCTLKVMLDSYLGNKLTYWVYPNGVMTIVKTDKIIFHKVFVKNTHATDNVSANEIKVVVDNL